MAEFKLMRQYWREPLLNFIDNMPEYKKAARFGRYLSYEYISRYITNTDIEKDYLLLALNEEERFKVALHMSINDNREGEVALIWAEGSEPEAKEALDICVKVAQANRVKSLVILDNELNNRVLDLSSYKRVKAVGVPALRFSNNRPSDMVKLF